MATEKKEVQVFILPEARVINCSLFERDIYKDPQTGREGNPSYKIELAFDPDTVEGEGTFEDALIDYACDQWGDDAEDDWANGEIGTPFLDGDRLAKRREEKDKPGDAYKGKLVLRTHTIYNKDGVDGAGGISVYGPDLSEITIMNKGEIYQGCYGCVAVTINHYVDSKTGQNMLMTYLSAFQKTKDGEKLVTPRDYSKLFKPVGRPATAKRRSRKG